MAALRHPDVQSHGAVGSAILGENVMRRRSAILTCGNVVWRGSSVLSGKVMRRCASILTRYDVVRRGSSILACRLKNRNGGACVHHWND